MLIYFSYKREDELLRDIIVRNISATLPSSFEFWVDVKKLQWGSNFPAEIEKAITEDADFLICLVSDKAGDSDWVMKEVELAKEREKKENRTFILPLVIKGTSRNRLWQSLDLGNKNYVEVYTGTEAEEQTQAEKITRMLFSLVAENLDLILHPQGRVDAIRENEKRLTDLAEVIRTVAFPHREVNPLDVSELAEKVCAARGDISAGDFGYIIDEIFRRNLLSGFVFDGDVIYLDEEHVSWNNRFHLTAKKAIAKKAYSYIGSKGDKTVYIDSGSTAGALVSYICDRMRYKTSGHRSLTVITPSTWLLQQLSDTCVSLGFSNSNDDVEKLKLIVPDGFIHTASSTIVQLDENDRDHISKLCERHGIDLDVAFIGANGITEEGGIMTYSNDEDYWKLDAMSVAAQTVIICDSAKFGVESDNLDSLVAGWDDDFILITDLDETNEVQKEIIKKHGDKIITV
ncbi:MAG: TIR domain-containing protein [Clostridia bacterium]|nr:TIR domain-containing protein [Clostridia bacterium]